MKSHHKLLLLPAMLLCCLQSCNRAETTPAEKPATYGTIPGMTTSTPKSEKPIAEDPAKADPENHPHLITEFDCPDSRFYLPIDIRYWDKVAVINGRFPSARETRMGLSVLHYTEKQSAWVKPYPITLPKLAYYNRASGKTELVVVIQVVQSASDTVVAYRYLTGGCGGSAFHNFHFLTAEETQELNIQKPESVVPPFISGTQHPPATGFHTDLNGFPGMNTKDGSEENICLKLTPCCRKKWD